MKYTKLAALCVGGGLLVYTADVRAQIKVDPNEGYYSYQRSNAAQLVARFNQVNATLAEDPPEEKAIPLYKEARAIWLELKTTYVNLLPSATNIDALTILRANIAQADKVITQATTYLETHHAETPPTSCFRLPAQEPKVQTPLPADVHSVPATTHPSTDRFSLDGCYAAAKAKQAKAAQAEREAKAAKEHEARKARAAYLVGYIAMLENFIKSQPNSSSLPTWLQWLFSTQTELLEIYNKELPSATDPERLVSNIAQLEQKHQITKMSLNPELAFPVQTDPAPATEVKGDPGYYGYQHARIAQLVVRFNQINSALAENPPIARAIQLYTEVKGVATEVKKINTDFLSSETDPDVIATINANIAKADKVMRQADAQLFQLHR